mgnify:CR=1 FL=1
MTDAEIKARMVAQGYTAIGTGGGCEAWERRLDDGPFLWSCTENNWTSGWSVATTTTAAISKWRALTRSTSFSTPRPASPPLTARNKSPSNRSPNLRPRP